MTIAEHVVAPGDTPEDSRSTSPRRFTMIRIGDEDWLIHDTAYPENDARHLVACVRARGLDHVDVIWLQGRGLARRYARVADVLTAAERALSSRSGLAAARPENWLG
ncbi:hypothetical protein [Microbacterium sp. 10M-3C3]|jgi:hypothetical protein|uniref:hypothetical protein n=1 Tax=Microbacterium sp. 10M-3C3 TaxID=2483401 RepID=UPI000F62DFEE|nr:hypothetical protein [Microbacterium sp. 10M-3C3]